MHHASALETQSMTGACQTKLLCTKQPYLLHDFFTLCALASCWCARNHDTQGPLCCCCCLSLHTQAEEPQVAVCSSAKQQRSRRRQTEWGLTANCLACATSLPPGILLGINRSIKNTIEALAAAVGCVCDRTTAPTLTHLDRHRQPALQPETCRSHHNRA